MCLCLCLNIYCEGREEREGRPEAEAHGFACFVRMAASERRKNARAAEGKRPRGEEWVICAYTLRKQLTRKKKKKQASGIKKREARIWAAIKLGEERSFDRRKTQDPPHISCC